MSLLGRQGYNVVFSNCEHFATYCFSGDFRSSQVRAHYFFSRLVYFFRLASRMPIHVRFRVVWVGAGGGGVCWPRRAATSNRQRRYRETLIP
jgi:hypothetical protein